MLVIPLPKETSWERASAGVSGKDRDARKATRQETISKVPVEELFQCLGHVKMHEGKAPSDGAS